MTNKIIISKGDRIPLTLYLVRSKYEPSKTLGEKIERIGRILERQGFELVKNFNGNEIVMGVNSQWKEGMPLCARDKRLDEKQIRFPCDFAIGCGGIIYANYSFYETAPDYWQTDMTKARFEEFTKANKHINDINSVEELGKILRGALWFFPSESRYGPFDLRIAPDNIRTYYKRTIYPQTLGFSLKGPKGIIAFNITLEGYTAPKVIEGGAFDYRAWNEPKKRFNRLCCEVSSKEEGLIRKVKNIVA